jgi:aspartate racemase
LNEDLIGDFARKQAERGEPQKQRPWQQKNRRGRTFLGRSAIQANKAAIGSGRAMAERCDDRKTRLYASGGISIPLVDRVWPPPRPLAIFGLNSTEQDHQTGRRNVMVQQAVIGLIGGMSWESSAEYYRIINQETRRRLGGVHSARSLMWSVDFGDIESLQHQGEWDRLAEAMKDAAGRLERGGADFLVLCTNTMHRFAAEIVEAVAIPLVHIADTTAEAVRAGGFQRVGLLGTAFTMEQDFYKGRLEAAYGLQVLIPEAADRRVVHDIIYRELVAGQILPSSREAYREVIARLIARGAQAIILGCTEIMLLLSESDSSVPLFDTTSLHAVAAVKRALAATERR